MSERQKTQIKLKGHPHFPVSTEAAMVTTDELEKYVNTLFSNVFKDYVGCSVYCDVNSNPNRVSMPTNHAHPVQVDLFFKLLPNHREEDGLVAFKSISDKVAEDYAPQPGRRNFSAAIMGYNELFSSNKSATITQDGIDIFRSMLWMEVARGLPMEPTAKDFNNKNIVVESSTTSGTTSYMTAQTQIVIYNVVQFVDINSIMDTLFGSPKDSPKEYIVIPIKPIISMQNPMQIMQKNSKWLFNVNRVDAKSIMDKCNELGKFNIGGGLNITQETMPI